MRRNALLREAVACAFLALLLTAPAGALSQLLPDTPSSTTSPPGQTYPSSSWGLGIVVPEGATLLGGGRVSWGGVSNVTAVVTLPNISLPYGIVYAVLSVMTGDGSVLQAALGVRANGTVWAAYAWLISDAKSDSPNYDWLLNGSEPEAAPGANITMSIFRAAGTWSMGIVDEGTGASVERAFPEGGGAFLKAGDQEVFSLESYSRAATTFRDMGNLTLNCLLLDGAKVVGGAYSYGDWDPAHNPLFVVGSSGASPPPFIYLLEPEAGTFVWGYTTVWGSGSGPLPISDVLALLLVAILAASAAALWRTRKAREAREPEHPARLQ